VISVLVAGGISVRGSYSSDLVVRAPGWLVSAGVAAGATTALGYGAASWFDRGERLSRERLQGISRSVGETFVAHLRGRRRPGRGEIEREVELILEDTPPPEA